MLFMLVAENRAREAESKSK